MTNTHATCTDRHRSADVYRIPAGEGMFPLVTRVIASPVRAGRPQEDGRATRVIDHPFCTALLDFVRTTAADRERQPPSLGWVESGQQNPHLSTYELRGLGC